MTNKWVYDGHETWRIGTEFISIDAYEDCDRHDRDKCECTEVWLGDDKTGNCDTEGIFDSYDEAIEHVRQFIKETPDGWMLKDKQRTEKEKREVVSFT